MLLRCTYKHGIYIQDKLKQYNTIFKGISEGDCLFPKHRWVTSDSYYCI